MKRIKGLSNYAITEDGRVWSDNLNGFMRQQEKFGRSKNKGYMCVSVVYDNGEKKKRTVHSLVLEAFVGKRPKGYECDHIDGDKHNNHISNLEWVTPEENARRMGLMSRTVFSESDCRIMDELYESYPVSYIATYFNCSSNLIKSSLVSRGIFDGRINRMGGSNGTVSESEKREIRRLFKTGKYDLNKIKEVLGLKISTSGIGYYIEDLPRRNHYIRENVSSDYLNGLLKNDILSDYGISNDLFKKILKERGIPLRSEDVYDKSTEYIIKDLERFSKLVNEGYTINMLAEAFDCGHKAVKGALKRSGLKTQGIKRSYDYKELYEINLTMPQWKIAEKLGISQSGVAVKIRKYKEENGITNHGNKKAQ